MKKEYDFSKGQRGRFYRPDVELIVPLYLAPDVVTGVRRDRRSGAIEGMMPRKPRAIGELQKASDHLYYEYSMLVTVAKGLASGIAGQGPLLNALLESFVIHVRAVMDFLYAGNPKPDDVVAEDFFDNPEEWTKDRPEMSQLLVRARRRAGKEVAHLTYARLEVTPETKPWEFAQIEKEISAVFLMFLQKVQRNKLGPHWFDIWQPKSEGEQP